MATASNKLTEAEQAFLVYDWASSEKWQSYLMNLYPVPPQDKIVKWKIKFFKAQVNPDLNPDSPAFTAALAQHYPSAACRTRPAAAGQSSYSSSSGWPQSPNASSQESRNHSASSPRFSKWRKKILPPLCTLGLILGLALSFAGAATQSAGAFTHSSAGTLLLFSSFLTHVYIVLGKPPFRMADLSSTMSSAFASYMHQAIVQDSTHAVLYLLLTSTLPRSFPALFSPTISAMLVISSLLAAGDGFPAFLFGMPMLRNSVQKIQAGRYRLMQHRADVEVFFGIFFIGSRILTLNFSLSGSIVPAFLYINLLKIRYSTCGFTHTTFQRINGMSTVTALLVSYFGRLDVVNVTVP